MKWKTGDPVVHNRDGICTVVDIKEMALGGEPETYYILEPVYENGSRLYIPVTKEDSLLRAPVTKEEIQSYVKSLPDSKLTWISDQKERQSMITDVRKTGSSRTWLPLILLFYQERSEKHRQGKKFHAFDEQFLKDIETRVNREFGYVLGIEPSEVPDYIKGILKAG